MENIESNIADEEINLFKANLAKFYNSPNPPTVSPPLTVSTENARRLYQKYGSDTARVRTDYFNLLHRINEMGIVEKIKRKKGDIKTDSLISLLCDPEYEKESAAKTYMGFLSEQNSF